MSEQDLLAPSLYWKLIRSKRVFTTKCVMQRVALVVRILDIAEESESFELMRMSDSIHSLVIKSASAPDIEKWHYKRA